MTIPSTASEIHARWVEYGAEVARRNYDLVDSIGDQAAAQYVAFAHSEQLPDVVDLSPRASALADFDRICGLSRQEPKPTPRRNGCHNRKPFAATTVVQDGWLDLPVDGFGNRSRVPRWREIPFRMRQECSYANETDLGRADKGCLGCTWRNA